MSEDRDDLLNKVEAALHTARDTLKGCAVDIARLEYENARLKAALEEKDEALEHCAEIADVFADEADAEAMHEVDDALVAEMRAAEDMAVRIAKAIRARAARVKE